MESSRFPLDSAILDVSGRAVRYRRAGSGPPIVLLHGIGRSLEDFSELEPLLASDHTVVSIDLAGFGGSAPIPTLPLPAIADHVLATLDALAAAEPRGSSSPSSPLEEPFDLVGNSLGGAVAMFVATRAPARVHTLTLLNSAGFGRGVALSLRIVGLPFVGRALLAQSRKKSKDAVRSLFVDRALATRERIEHAYALSTREGGTDSMYRVLRATGSWRGQHRRWRRALLPRVAALDAPVLVAWGSGDLVLPARHLDAARRILPTARTHLFEDTGHMPQIERAIELADLLRAHIATGRARESR